ncbi:MAG: Ig-like domain-containing protein, partial [Janthinobacterium lividum]
KGATPNATGDVITKDDHVTTPYNASITLPGVLDDHPNDPSQKMRPDLTRFDVDHLGPDDYLSPDTRTIRYPGRGTWTINADGTVLYVPRPGFVGRDGMNMIVFTNSLQRGEQELVVTVEPGPAAKPDTPTIAQNVTTSLAVLTNDTPGQNADATPGSIDTTSVTFPTSGQPAGATVSASSRALTVAEQGVYTADPTTGTITFDPDPSFTGEALPVTYSAHDTVTRTDGRLVHNPVTTTLTVTVTPINPVALNNWISTPVGKSVEIPVLGNDKPGAASAPLVTTSIRLRLTPGLPDGSKLYADAKALLVAGDGTFARRADGVVVFTPVRGFAGQVPTIGYQVSDTNGTNARATITVQVRTTG